MSFALSLASQSRERCSITACQVSHDQLAAQPGLRPVSTCRWAAVLVDSAHPAVLSSRTGFSVSPHTQVEREARQCGLASLAFAMISSWGNEKPHPAMPRAVPCEPNATTQAPNPSLTWSYMRLGPPHGLGHQVRKHPPPPPLPPRVPEPLYT